MLLALFINLMGLDINELRKEKGGDPEAVLASEKKRFRKPDQNYAEQAMSFDDQWRKKHFEYQEANKAINALQTKVGAAKKEGKACEEELAQLTKLKTNREHLEKEEEELLKKRDDMLKQVGNIVHESVVVSQDEDKNEIVRTWGKISDIKVDSTPGKCAHHQLLAMIDGYDPKRGQKIAGHRGYFLKGMGALLNMALVNYGMHFLTKKNYTILHTPFFMKKSIMAETCQLADFDEQLYKVTTGKEEPDSDFYLIATSEQPISAYFYKESIEAKDLPMRYCGYSSCFRKEAGAHGKDNLGIFRIHQFEKVEQFSITEPEDSWKEHERMIKVSEEFYQSLNLPYRVVSIVSGALNDAAAKKYDLEAWFPSYNTFRELVSCSNCTDFQSRGLEVKCFGQKKEHHEDEHCTKDKKECCDKKETAECCEKKKECCDKKSAEECCKEKKECCDKKETTECCQKAKDEKADIKEKHDEKEAADHKEKHEKKEKHDEKDAGDKKDKHKDAKDKKQKDDKKEEKGSRLVHMLNGTLCASERTLCCILENYQTEKGIVVPEVLRPYVGTDFIPYTKPIPKDEKHGKEEGHHDEKKEKDKKPKAKEEEKSKSKDKKEQKKEEKKEEKK